LAGSNRVTPNRDTTPSAPAATVSSRIGSPAAATAPSTEWKGETEWKGDAPHSGVKEVRPLCFPFAFPVLQRIPGLRLAHFPVSISFGGIGGRLWGFGFALPKNQRTFNASSYMLMRVDYHGVQIQDHLHRLPYASFFRQNPNAIELHWQIPTSPKDARGGLPSE
jgi:hypothetical protein